MVDSARDCFRIFKGWCVLASVSSELLLTPGFVDFASFARCYPVATVHASLVWLAMVWLTQGISSHICAGSVGLMKFPLCSTPLPSCTQGLRLSAGCLQPSWSHPAVSPWCLLLELSGGLSLMSLMSANTKQFNELSVSPCMIITGVWSLKRAQVLCAFPEK